MGDPRIYQLLTTSMEHPMDCYRASNPIQWEGLIHTVPCPSIYSIKGTASPGQPKRQPSNEVNVLFWYYDHFKWQQLGRPKHKKSESKRRHRHDMGGLSYQHPAIDRSRVRPNNARDWTRSADRAVKSAPRAWDRRLHSDKKRHYSSHAGLNRT